MAGYAIAEVEVLNPEGYQTYSSQVMTTVQAYGGEFLVRGGRAEIIEGEGEPHRVVVLRFESAERARAWYFSTEYQAIAPIRQQNTRTRMIIVEGV